MLEQLVANEESLVFLCLTAAGIVAILVFGLGSTVVTLFRVSVEGRLKQQMLDRGMSALEIEQVLKATAEKSEDQGQPNKKQAAAENRAYAAHPSKARL